MEDTQRWSVTYTKHVKQKRKIYHDGFLELQSTRHKVMLYDEWDKLLESRFVKKDDVIISGETLSFGSYLVDIGELCGCHKPTSTVNRQENVKKVPKKSEFISPQEDRKPVHGKSKGRVINLSPSEKIIRDFKKSEMNKCLSSPNCVDITRTSTIEWQVLYTTHITQKAKKFHDGFLQLIVRGSQGRQVKLYDTNKRLLDSRFLKKDEIVHSGESLPFEGLLVEIGEQEGDHKPVTDSTIWRKNCEVVVKTDISDHQARIPMRKKFPAGKYPDKTSPGKLSSLNYSRPEIQNAQLNWRTPPNEPKRAVHDILSILRQPIHRKAVKMDKLSMEVEDCLESHSSHDIIEYAEECSGSAQEELREKISDHCCKIKILAAEAAEVLFTAEKCTVSEYERDSQAESSSFCLRPGIANCMVSIINAQCTDHNKLTSSPLSLEHPTMVTAALDYVGQKPIESATLIRTNENEEPKNPPEICKCEDVMTEQNAAATNGLSSSKLSMLLEDNMGISSRCLEAASSTIVVASNDCKPHDLSGVEEKNLEQGFHTVETYEFPSFDLGF